MCNNNERIETYIDVCELLSRVFRIEANEDFLNELSQLNYDNYWSYCDFLVRGIGDDLKLIDSVLLDKSFDRQKLRFEYAKLFIGPNQLVAPPMGSVYLDGGSLMGASTLRVRACYEKYGVSVANKNKEPDDHISYELSFVAHLLAKSLVAETNEEKVSLVADADSFSQEFMKPWVDSFADAIEGADISGFYKGFAGILKQVVNCDLRDL